MFSKINRLYVYNRKIYQFKKSLFFSYNFYLIRLSLIIFFLLKPRGTSLKINFHLLKIIFSIFIISYEF